MGAAPLRVEVGAEGTGLDPLAVGKTAVKIIMSPPYRPYSPHTRGTSVQQRGDPRPHH